eukprot:1419087-Prymnesium_polylepis.1
MTGHAGSLQRTRARRRIGRRGTGRERWSHRRLLEDGAGTTQRAVHHLSRHREAWRGTWRGPEGGAAGARRVDAICVRRVAPRRPEPERRHAWLRGAGTIAMSAGPGSSRARSWGSYASWELAHAG